MDIRSKKTRQTIAKCFLELLGKTPVSKITVTEICAMAKINRATFYKNMFKSKRKSIEEIWFGEYYLEAANIARFAPSACNTQPWIVESDEQELKAFRYKKPGKRGIMPADKVSFYNRIDIGIFLLILEVCLKHEGIVFERTLVEYKKEEEKNLIAIYAIK